MTNTVNNNKLLIAHGLNVMTTLTWALSMQQLDKSSDEAITWPKPEVGKSV